MSAGNSIKGVCKWFQGGPRRRPARNCPVKGVWTLSTLTSALFGPEAAHSRREVDGSAVQAPACGLQTSSCERRVARHSIELNLFGTVSVAPHWRGVKSGFNCPKAIFLERQFGSYFNSGGSKADKGDSVK